MMKPRDLRLMGLGMRIRVIDSKLGRLQGDLLTLREKLKESQSGLTEIIQMYRDENAETLRRIQDLERTIENLNVEKQNLEGSLTKVLQGGTVRAYRSYRP